MLKLMLLKMNIILKNIFNKSLRMKVNKSYKIVGILLIYLLIAILVSVSHKRKSLYPDVLLITVDALRADHLSSYGYFKKNIS